MAEIGSGVWGTPAKRVSLLGSVTVPVRHSSSGRQPNGVEQRAPPMFGRATIRLGIGPHSSCCYFLSVTLIVVGAAACQEMIARYVSFIPSVSDSVVFPGLCDIWSNCSVSTDSVSFYDAACTSCLLFMSYVAVLLPLITGTFV